MFLSESRLKKGEDSKSNSWGIRWWQGILRATSRLRMPFSVVSERILDKDCCKLALLTLFCASRKFNSSSTAGWGLLGFSSRKKSRGRRSSQRCARHQCRRWHVAVRAKRKRRQQGLKSGLGAPEGVSHGMLSSLKTSSGPHADVGAAAEPTARAGEARLPPVGALRTPAALRKMESRNGVDVGLAQRWQ